MADAIITRQQTTLGNNDTIRLMNAWNLDKTAHATEQTAAATERTAAATEDLAKEVSMLVEGQVETNVLLHLNVLAALETNSTLANIAETLNQIQSSIEAATGTLERQEQLHQQHYNRLERERSLKELLYNIKRFIADIQTLGDPFAAEYGTRVYQRMITESRFGTRDLSDIEDKEYFDNTMKACEDIRTTVDPNTISQIDNFETVLATYNAILAKDVDSMFPTKKQLDAVSEDDCPLEEPTLPSDISEVGETEIRMLCNYLSRSKNARRLLFVGLAIFTLGLMGSSLVIASIFSLSLFCLGGIMIPVGAFWMAIIDPSNFWSLRHLSPKEKARFRTLLLHIQGSLKRRQEFLNQLHSYSYQKHHYTRKRHEWLMNETKRIIDTNQEIPKHNKRQHRLRKQARLARTTMLRDMVAVIKATLDKHPALKNFVPNPVAAR